MQCTNECQCSFRFKEKASVFDCENVGLTNIARLEVPNESTWLIASHNKINNLCWSDNMKDIERFEIHSSKIFTIYDEFFSKLNATGERKYLDIAKNNLKVISKSLKSVKQLDVYLAGNPIECNCDTLWVTQWFNTTGGTGHKIVKDYKDIKCVNAKWNGLQVYQLNGIEMGCFPKILARYECKIFKTYIYFDV